MCNWKETVMGARYHIDLFRKELATLSYFPGLEFKKNLKAEWIEDFLIPVLLPVVRRKNKKISEIPITFWVTPRQTARPFSEEIFLFQTPAFPGVILEKAIKEALQMMEKGMVFAGKENISEVAVPVCQLFRNKLIRFYCGIKEFEPHFLPAFEWKGNRPAFTQSYLEHSAIMLENRDSDILFMRANIDSLDCGEYNRKFQKALNCIGIEE
jgi:hypothetical protein